MIAKDCKPEYLGTPIKTTFILDSGKGNEDGKDVLYFSVTGTPSTFVVYDVNEKKTIRQFTHESEYITKCAWTQRVDNYGNVYTVAAGYPTTMFKYDAKTLRVKIAVPHTTFPAMNPIICISVPLLTGKYISTILRKTF